MLVGQALESAGSLREAEKHYTDGKEWKAAVQMYRTAVRLGGGGMLCVVRLCMRCALVCCSFVGYRGLCSLVAVVCLGC